VDVNFLTVRGSDPGTFLATVLEREQPKESKAASLSVWHIHANDTTLFPGVVKRESGFERFRLDIHVLIVFFFWLEVNLFSKSTIPDTVVSFSGEPDALCDAG
jgi:hypothetical protein